MAAGAARAVAAARRLPAHEERGAPATGTPSGRGRAAVTEAVEAMVPPRLAVRVVDVRRAALPAALPAPAPRLPASATKPRVLTTNDPLHQGRMPLPPSAAARHRGRRSPEEACVMDGHPGRVVVVGVDGSAEALRAVRWAVPEARRRRAVLLLVTAFPWTDDRMVGIPGLGSGAYGDRLRAAAQRALTAAAAAATALDPDLRVEQELVVGYPVGVLVARSRSAELLVVADHGRGRVVLLLAGSVAVGVAAQAACPVVVVRGGDPAVRPSGGRIDQRPVVVGVDGTALSDAALAFAFDAASERHARSSRSTPGWTCWPIPRWRR